MANRKPAPTPDLTKGIPANSLTDGQMIAGRVGTDDVVVACAKGQFFAVGRYCTHYKGDLSKGLVVGGTVRCPWHHACFNLHTGAVERAPALDPVGRWRIEARGDLLVVGSKIEEPKSSGKLKPSRDSSAPASVVIIGGGAAGLAAALTLRREHYSGPVTIVSADNSAPCDRPNLSKDYLAGEAQEDWIPLREPKWYRDNRIDLWLNSRVKEINPASKQVVLGDGRTMEYGALLLATGSEPVKLDVPGANGRGVRYLRSFADSKSIIADAEPRSRAVIIGASFIGLEVAASLRARKLRVDVVAPDKLPLEKVMGPALGRAIKTLHESHGVRFHLGQSVTHIDDRGVVLANGKRLEADLVLAGIGVRPNTALADAAGLEVDNGVLVNEFLETSAPGIFAAGDIARWPERVSGQRVRVEHWVVAERQGETAARNILGRTEPFDSAPFFWSQHYDVTIRYTGHAAKWDETRVSGSPAKHDCRVEFVSGGRVTAVATIGRDLESLEAEVELERRPPV
jgi:NADPH-dependent 2,4-dienoyl-CoA reductase/sulfur reductase-like enzyme/nitrite reductase/ring-hydroxylating ferredoxin subunit